MKEKLEQILATIDKNSVEFINYCFTDINGRLKEVEIPSYIFVNKAKEEILQFKYTIKPEDFEVGFDGSSVEGYRDIEESDMKAIPDFDTFYIVPKNITNNFSVARFICDIRTPDNNPYEGDPRKILKDQIKKFKSNKLIPQFGVELEFFILDNNLNLIDKESYFGISNPVLKKIIKNLLDAGVSVEALHHEVSPSQYEVDLHYGGVLQMADNIQKCKQIIKETVKTEGLYATFLPKICKEINGSGMHTHQSLFKNKKNIMYDIHETGLSKIGRSYLSGILNHAQEITAIINPTINSYKRLVPGFEAPVYIAWSRANRSVMVRIPNMKPNNREATRLELRSPDSSGNPYLQFAVLLGAGFKGIETNLYKDLPKPIDSNLYEMSNREKRKLSIHSLPGNLEQALNYMKSSSLTKEILGEHTFNRFLEIKTREIEEYNTQITKWELDNYIPYI